MKLRDEYSIAAV